MKPLSVNAQRLLDVLPKGRWFSRLELRAVGEGLGLSMNQIAQLHNGLWLSGRIQESYETHCGTRYRVRSAKQIAAWCRRRDAIQSHLDRLIGGVS